MIKILLAHAAQHILLVYQYDFKTAFLKVQWTLFPSQGEKKSGSAKASQPGIKLNQPASEKKRKKEEKGP